MTRTDSERVVEVIASSSKVDARAASRYFHSYFQSKTRLNDEHEQVYVGEHFAEVVGIVGISPDKYRTVGLAWLSWLYVDVGHQRAGFGTQLVRHILAEARRLNTRKICVESSSHPIYEASLRLYSRMGFTQDGLVEDYYEPGQDLILMSQALHSCKSE